MESNNVFVCRNIEEEIFGVNNEFTKLIIITGYITPSYIKKIYQSFQGNIEIYLGMGDTKYKSSIYTSIKSIMTEILDERISFYYTNFDVHAKLYKWFGEDKNKTLIGSANFSKSMTINDKEILGTIDNEQLVDNFITLIRNNSQNIFNVDESKIIAPNKRLNKRQDAIPFEIDDETVSISLLANKDSAKKNIYGMVTKINNVPMCSGINWGFSNGHVKPNDAYIPISLKLIKIKESIFQLENNGNLIYDVIWDDGVTMKMLFEGTQNYNGKKYPNKISSYGEKGTLGKYLRKRIGDKINKELVIPSDITHKELIKNKGNKKYIIKVEDLKKYGRFNIGITKIDDIYYFDFSV